MPMTSAEKQAARRKRLGDDGLVVREIAVHQSRLDDVPELRRLMATPKRKRPKKSAPDA